MNQIRLLFVFLFMNLNWLYAQDKTTIIYIGDPMCSWCYGFAPEILKVKEHYSDFDFKLVMGGLRPYGKETMKELGDFLKHHWKDVHKASDQPFSYDILKNESFVYDTEPACRATVVAREMKPEIEFPFFKAIQSRFYVHNDNTNNMETYLLLAEEFGLDKEEFKKQFESEEIKKKTQEDFSLSSQMGIKGFPSVIISQNGNLTLVSNGYMKAETLIENIKKVTKQ